MNLLRKISEFKKRNNTPQLAIENTQNKLRSEDAQKDYSPGVIFDTSLEYTSEKMKTPNNSLK